MVLNKVDETYHTYLKEVLTDERTNYRPAARTSASTIGTFGKRMEFNCSEELPASTTKPIFFKALNTELVAFTRGESDLKFFLERDCNIWNGNGFDYNRRKFEDNHKYGNWKNLKKDTPLFNEAQQEYIKLVKEGKLSDTYSDLGGIYGVQWRRWPTQNGETIDQLAKSIEQLKENPFSRYHLVSAWNPGEIRRMALPPCHMKFQFYARKDEKGEWNLDSSMDQRSCDSLLGVPFNFTSESMKLKMIANLLGYKPGTFIQTLEDAHIYCGKGDRAEWYGENLYELKKEVAKCNTPEEYLSLKEDLLSVLPDEEPGAEGLDHVPFVLEQLSRQESKIMPKVSFKGPEALDINKIDLDNIVLDGYESHKGLLIPCKSLEGKLIKPKMAA